MKTKNRKENLQDESFLNKSFIDKSNDLAKKTNQAAQENGNQKTTMITQKTVKQEDDFIAILKRI